MKKTTAKENLNSLKSRAAAEVGVSMKNTETMSTKSAGKVGGQMVKDMVNSYENSTAKKTAKTSSAKTKKSK